MLSLVEIHRHEISGAYISCCSFQLLHGAPGRSMLPAIVAFQSLGAEKAPLRVAGLADVAFLIGGFLKCWVSPTTSMGFPTKK